MVGSCTFLCSGVRGEAGGSVADSGTGRSNASGGGVSEGEGSSFAGRGPVFARNLGGGLNGGSSGDG